MNGITEFRRLPNNTYMVETEKGSIFVDATSITDAENKAKQLGYVKTSGYETIEVIVFR